MPLSTLLPAFNEDILHGQADDLGYLLSAMGGGAIVGSLMMAAMGSLKNKTMWLIVTCVGWGAVTVAFGFAKEQVVAMLLIGMVGWVSSWNMSLNRGMLQMKVSHAMRGRIMSIDMMSHGLMPLGIFPISYIAQEYDVGTALVVSGLAFMALTLICVALVPAVRKIDAEHRELTATAGS
jgi:sugar phosphate permease